MSTNQTVTATGPSPREVARRRNRRLFVIGAATVILGNAAPLLAFGFDFDGIIFDPQNYVENVQQLAQIIEQISQVRQQIDNELRMLRGLGVSGANGMLRAVTSAQSAMGSDGYGDNAGTDLDQRYPTQYEAPPTGTIVAARDQWEAASRQALGDARATQDVVVGDMPRVSDRVAEVVTASNAAEGETAAEQARNLLLAEANGEAGKLLAVKASRERFRVEQEARDQSELAYARARQRAVMADWIDLGATTPMTDPFGK